MRLFAIRYIILFVLLIIISNIYSQNLKQPLKKIQIGLNYSIDYNYRTLTINKENQGSRIYKESRNDYETAKYGYTGGILISLSMYSKITLTTGLQYSNKGYHLRTRSTAVFESEILNPSVNSLHSKYSYYYLDIPLSINYVIGKKRLQCLISTGLTTNVFIKDKISRKWNYNSNSPDIEFIPTYPSNKLIVSPTLGCGLNYRIHSKINIRMEPTIRYQLFNTRNTVLSAHLWNIGLNTGIYYGF